MTTTPTNQAREDAKQLRYHAAGLTYNDTNAEGEAKHRLHEIAMRIETSFYTHAAQPVPPAAVGAGEHNFTLTENHIELLATLLHYTGSGEIQKDLSAFCHDGRAAIATKAQPVQQQGAA